MKVEQLEIKKTMITDGEDFVEHSTEDDSLIIRIEGIAKMTPTVKNAKKLVEMLGAVLDKI